MTQFRAEASGFNPKPRTITLKPHISSFLLVFVSIMTIVALLIFIMIASIVLDILFISVAIISITVIVVMHGLAIFCPRP